MKTLDAVIDEKGLVRLLESVHLPAGQRVLVTVLEESAGKHDVARLEGCIPYNGAPVTIAEMNQAIMEEGAAG